MGCAAPSLFAIWHLLGLARTCQAGSSVSLGAIARCIFSSITIFVSISIPVRPDTHARKVLVCSGVFGHGRCEAVQRRLFLSFGIHWVWHSHAGLGPVRLSVLLALHSTKTHSARHAERPERN